MGLEIEISEMAALGPILTVVGAGCRGVTAEAAAVAAAAAAAAAAGSVVEGESLGPRQEDGGQVVDDEAGCVTPTARRDGGGGGGGGGEDGAAFGTGTGEGFVTPTTAESALGPATVCPPAPRKTGPAKWKRCDRPPLRVLFSVPKDLDAVFVPLTPPPSKKIRLHAVD